jgi:hypothetical protein
MHTEVFRAKNMRVAKAAILLKWKGDHTVHVYWETLRDTGVPPKAVKQPKRQFVHICIWETSGNDPCVFVARTEKRLYAEVWETIKDYWVDVMGEKVLVPHDRSEAVSAYAKECQERENGEYFTITKEEVK